MTIPWPGPIASGVNSTMVPWDEYVTKTSPGNHIRYLKGFVFFSPMKNWKTGLGHDPLEQEWLATIRIASGIYSKPARGRNHIMVAKKPLTVTLGA